LLLKSSQGRAATATHQRDIGLDEVVAGVEAGGEALALPLLHKVAQQVLGDVAVQVGEREAPSDVMTERSRCHEPDQLVTQPDAVVPGGIGVGRVDLE